MVLLNRFQKMIEDIVLLVNFYATRENDQATPPDRTFGRNNNLGGALFDDRVSGLITKAYWGKVLIDLVMLLLVTAGIVFGSQFLWNNGVVNLLPVKKCTKLEHLVMLFAFVELLV